jgi:transcriptional regulator with PAS, ATPase and Fis domain
MSPSFVGETGKNTHAIHNSSARQESSSSFNASAMTDTLLESQLFGRAGRLRSAASKGKIRTGEQRVGILDEIAEMSRWPGKNSARSKWRV